MIAGESLTGVGFAIEQVVGDWLAGAAG